MKSMFFITTLLVSLSSLAAERVTHTVTVTAQIPTGTFYVLPVGDWMSSQLKLSVNPSSQKLEPIVKELNMKSTIGPIKGFLSYPPVIVSGANNIGLTIKVAGVELTTTSTELLNLADARVGRQGSIEFIPAAGPTGGYIPGNYQGIVSMIFESEAPPAPPQT
ncbi:MULTISPECIES: CS1 type fimbrial major subunit [Aeromonas]|uniref:CS1 type fimbrial major subunit n=1 Tax=Aeromonas TaxID=642 RepID=UPI002AA2B410|nr:CS1 type fimbrial major subunit [Aeromonas salmonicida]